MRHLWILIIGLTLCCSTAFAAEAEPFKTKVNLVLEDGTIMLYAGTKKGVRIGDEFELVRNGVKVGTIKIVKTSDLASYAKIATGDVKPMDVAVRMATGKPAKAAPSDADKKKADDKAKADKKKADAKEKDKKTKKKDKDDKASAKKKDDAKEKDKDKAKAKPVEPPKPKPGEEPTALPATALGLSGLILMPTADVDGLNKGTVAIHHNNASSDTLDYSDTIYGFTYGVSKNVEVGYMNMTTSPEVPSTATATASDFKTNIISLKYQFHEAAPAGKGGNLASGMEYDYSFGLQYFNMSALPTSVSLDGSAKVTRFFLSASGAMQQGTLHLSLYSQTGTLFDNANNEAYDGFGYQIGFEYPLGDMADTSGAIQNRLSIIVEYDDKPFYLGVLQAPSVGLRFRQPNFSVTAGMLDVSDTGIFSLGGSYHF